MKHDRFRLARWSLAGLLTVLLSGCGGGGNTSSVTGKVTFNGKTVTGGTLTFAPVTTDKEAGKPGIATIQSDGSFTASTYKEGDGLLVGKHKVSYQAPEMPYPEGREPKPGESRPRSGFEGLTVKTAEIEIKPGSNTLTIELGHPGS